MLKKTICSAVLCLLGLPAVADVPFVVSANGQEVTDTKTGLIWQRCPLGMNLSQNDCVGSAGQVQVDIALTQAGAQVTSAVLAWRLPNIHELSSLADLNRQSPAIDSVAFPSTPAGNFWSATPHRTNPLGAWAVNFELGGVISHVYDASGAKTAYIRLVRTP